MAEERQDVSEHDFLSSTVKQFHSKLREEVKTCM